MFDKIAQIPNGLMRHWQSIVLYVLSVYGLSYVFKMLPRNTTMYAFERGIYYGVGMLIWDMKF